MLHYFCVSTNVSHGTKFNCDMDAKADQFTGSKADVTHDVRVAACHHTKCVCVWESMCTQCINKQEVNVPHLSIIIIQFQSRRQADHGNASVEYWAPTQFTFIAILPDCSSPICISGPTIHGCLSLKPLCLMSQQDLGKFVHAFIFSWINYYDGVFTGL